MESIFSGIWPRILNREIFFSIKENLNYMGKKDRDIRAYDVTVGSLLSSGNRFEIPEFQRAFSWGEEQFLDLIDDIETALQTSESEYVENKKISSYDPYFLGSIILKKKGQNDESFRLIDGQQRLTSLILLFATLEDLTNNGNNKKRIWTEEDTQRGIKREQRLVVRKEEAEFFKEYVVRNEGTKEALELNIEQLSAPKQNMVEAISIFRDRFTDENGEPEEEFISKFTRYLCQKVTLVNIIAYSLNSAFKLFNITNARGLPLTNADLLKSINLGEIQDNEERNTYAKEWENLEEEIGNEDLEMLISFIRHIKVKEKAKKSIYDEFENKVFQKEREFKGTQFFNYLFKIAEIYKEKILDANIETGDAREEIYYYNLMSLLSNFYPSDDWMTAFIKFIKKYEDDKALYKFLKKYEKKIATDWLSGKTSTERLTQIYYVIEEIENNDNPNELLESDILNDYDESKLDKVENYLRLENF